MSNNATLNDESKDRIDHKSLRQNDKLNQIAEFREILFWPLLLEGKSGSTDSQAIEDAIKALTKTQQGHWKECSDLFTCAGKDIKQGSPPDEDLERTIYSALVYFHPFVREFLYPPAGEGVKDSKPPPVRILRRSDVRKVCVSLSDIDAKEARVDLGVRRLQLYLFDTRVALLTVEVVASNWTLAQVQQFQDQFRRVYPPYWFENREHNIQAGHSPQRVKWITSGDKEISSLFDENMRQQHIGFTRDSGDAPVCNHWAGLLQPLEPGRNQETINSSNSNAIVFRQLLDDRMPAMSYIAVRAIRGTDELTRGDFVRLAFFDEKGPSGTLPSSSQILQSFERDYCYDRFWNWKTEGHEWMTTRYLCTGYGFVVIGDAGDKTFFTNKTEGALAHFRHHYFLMGLIIHFHHASLLSFKDRISGAVKHLQDVQDGVVGEAFRKEIKKLQIDLLQFTHRYWFSQISNQLQAQELFELWRRHVKTRELYDELLREIQAINHALDTEAQMRQTDKTIHLSWIATIGLGVILLLTWYTTPYPASILIWANQLDLQAPRWAWLQAIRDWFGLLLLLLYSVITAFLMLIIYWLARCLSKRRNRKREK